MPVTYTDFPFWIRKKIHKGDEPDPFLFNVNKDIFDRHSKFIRTELVTAHAIPESEAKDLVKRLKRKKVDDSKWSSTR